MNHFNPSTSSGCPDRDVVSLPNHRTMTQLHLIISGLVQGVFFRASARDAAQALGLTGWVKNLPDGRVETVAEGPKEKLLEYEAWCRHGPPGARVTDVDSRFEPATGEFRNFAIRH